MVSPSLSMCPRASLNSRYVLVSNSSLRASFYSPTPAEREQKRARHAGEKKGFAPTTTTTLFLRLLRRKRRDVESLLACLPVLEQRRVAYIPAWKADQCRVFFCGRAGFVGWVFECCACCLLFRWRLVFCTWDVIVVGLL